jgi:hypothetical protein
VFRLASLYVQRLLVRILYSIEKRKEMRLIEHVKLNIPKIKNLFFDSWLRLEINIDLSNDVMMEKNPESLGRKLPVSFKYKLAIYKKGHESIPELADLAERATQILEKANRLSNLRHDLIHALQHPIEKDGKLTFSRIRVSGETWLAQNTTYSMDDLIKSLEELYDLEALVADQYMSIRRELGFERFKD